MSVGEQRAVSWLKPLKEMSRQFGLAAWARLAVRLCLSLIVLESGTRGLLAIKAYAERGLPVCYEYVTVRCRTPDYNDELTAVVQLGLLTGVNHVPHYRGEWISTNAQGFRGTVNYGPKSPGTLRVAVLGGSAAWGTFVHDDETLPFYLASALAERLEQPVEVVNAAVTSATSFQELIRLEADVLPLAPDIVVVFDGRNDLYFSNAPGWDAARTPAIQGYEAAVNRYAEAEPSAVLDVAWRSAVRYYYFVSLASAATIEA